ncbi:MAG: hypothetical protein HXY43_00270 [Fischerella sp.]|nr:hypothetical protein [Fischerella sp.]NWF57789.1 hypothetical protein [Fischerella sp.]
MKTDVRVCSITAIALQEEQVDGDKNLQSNAIYTPLVFPKIGKGDRTL